ncbi:SEC-C motif-containing protein [Paenibacillus taihuensis]|uniref:SEC-C motif-containing protein n=1 Tax=Paenibacillus taihuensis TaxID=1156355 RepID=A0A3D9RWU4_9BACL|nr:SEC-C domain-containing protein [Paenibacillus taihuensis]REE81546.1 SEC-C motif-containing protein [Paenibacillus taihuensis]
MDRQKELLQLNVANAIKGPAVTSLKDILAEITKDRLNFIASNCALAGRSKLKKQELADALYERITNPAFVRSAFIAAEPKEWELINALMSVPYIQENEIMPDAYLFLMDKGLVFSFLEQDELFIVMPKEVKAAYKKLDRRSFEEERSVSQLVLRYIEAAANLYGICPVEKLIAIINEQNNISLTEGEFNAIRLSVSDKMLYWDIQSGLILHEALEGEGLEDYQEFLESVKDKPYYMPPKEELLRYAELDYFEMTPQLEALKSHIVEKLGRTERQAEALMDDIQLACAMEEPLAVIMEEFEIRKIRLNKKQLEELMPIIIAVNNTTRMWSNRGFTPDELSPKPSPNTNNSNVVSFAAAASKISRNDPCPCGSGKKYKKCCM